MVKLIPCSGDTRRPIAKLSGYRRCAGSGSADPHQRGGASFQFPYVADGIYGILFHKCTLAGFSQRGIGTVPLKNIIKETEDTAE